MIKVSSILQQLKRRRGALSRPSAGRSRLGRTSEPFYVIDWAKAGIAAFTIAALSALMSVHLMPDKIALKPGETSDREVRAGRSVIYVSTDRTNQAALAARLATRPIYDTDEHVGADSNAIAQKFFEPIESAGARLGRHAGGKVVTVPQAADELFPLYRALLTREQLRTLLAMSPAVYRKLRDTATRLIADGEDREIRDKTDIGRISDDLSHARDEVTDSARDALASADYAAIVRAVAGQSLRPNRLLNSSRTLMARDAAARAINPDYRRIMPGDRIIGVGDTVTQDHIDKFTALGLLNPHLDPTTGAAICLLAAAMVLLVVYTIKRTLPALYADRKRLALLAVIVLFSVLGLKVGASMLGSAFGGQVGVGYVGMMSVAAAGMLVSVLLDMHLAVLVVALLSVQSGLIMNHEIRFTILTLMSSLVGIVSVSSARRRSHLPTTTLALALANLALVWLMGLLLEDALPELLTGSLWAVGSAVFATFLYWFGALALEKPFGILTHASLLDLSASDRPLLKQLCAIAPGTFAHSMMVGTLAEAGAQAVNTDALLCRVSGYYHDIGKIKAPEFFVENQRRENVHKRLGASISALIIAAHVRDGVNMADEHHLPVEIRDIIAQHHGTTLIRYFYHQALADCGGTDEAPPGLEERFRYSGPKPQTREAAVVMLADSVEAATRCLDKPSRERLEAEIDMIVRDKLEDGQLDECDLTFRDVKGISAAFLHVLAAMMHGRIDYPTLPARATARQVKKAAAAELVEEARAEILSTSESRFQPTSPYESIEPAERRREIAARMAAEETLGPLATCLFGSDPRPLGSGDPETTLPVAEPIAGAAAAVVVEARDLSRDLLRGEPEEVNGRLSVERATTSDTNDRTAPGGTSAAARRGSGARGGQRPTNG